MTKAHMLILHSEEELRDIATWLDEHPSVEEMIEAGIPVDAATRLDGFLSRLINESEIDAYPSFHPVPAGLAPLLQMAMDDWGEVLGAHDEAFFSSIVCTEA